MMIKRTPSLLCIVAVLLLAGHSLQAYNNITITQFVEMSNNATESVVFFVDSKFDRSRRFVNDGQLDSIADTLGKSYPSLSVFLVDRRNPGKAKGDALYDKFVIYQYPSVNMIMSSVRIPLPGAMEKDKVIERVARRLGNYPMEISTVHGINKLAQDRLIIYYHSTDPKFNYLMKGFSCRFIKPQFVQLQSAGLVSRVAENAGFTLQPWNTTVLLAKHPHSNTLRQMKPMKRFSMIPLIHFILVSAKPPATNFDKNSVAEIQQFKKATLLYTCDPKVHSSQIDIITKAAESRFKDVKVLFVDPRNTLGIDFLTSVGFAVDFPSLYLIRKRSDGKYSKFIYKSGNPVTVSAIKEFIEDCADNMIPKHYRSEVEPATDLYPNVKTLVGTTVQKTVFKDKDHYHIVFLYNSATVGSLPSFARMADKFRQEKVKFYIMDTDKNESPRIRPSHEGKILFYSKALKLHRTFSLDKSTNSLSKFGVFLENNLKKDKELLEEVRKANFWQDI